MEDKKTQIMLAAEKLFSQQGYNGTSVRDIAHEAGINVAMISYYFGSKEKLMEAVFKGRMQDSRLHIESIVENRTLTPMQKVDMVIDHYIEKVLNQPDYHKMLIREQMADKNSLIAGITYETKKANQEIVRKLIEEGQAQKLFKKNVDMGLMMCTLVGTVMNSLQTQEYIREQDGKSGISDEAFKDHLKNKLSTHLKMLFKAILTYEIQDNQGM